MLADADVDGLRPLIEADNRDIGAALFLDVGKGCGIECRKTDHVKNCDIKGI